jgi:hypothetical protein
LPDGDSEFSFVESGFAGGLPRQLNGSSLAEDVNILTQHWGSLVGNTDLLLRLSQMNHRVGLGNQEKVELGLADAEFSTSLVATKVGDRPATLGTESIFQLLEGLVGDIGKV